jgi:hypothetical protein
LHFKVAFLLKTFPHILTNKIKNLLIVVKQFMQVSKKICESVFCKAVLVRKWGKNGEKKM